MFAFPGDPVTRSFWSEENNGAGRDVAGDRRFTLTTGPGTIPPGESRTVDLGLLFALGADRLDSITRLRAASDLVQERYDAGTLRATSPPPDRPPPSDPALLSPANGVGPLEGPVTMTWAAVPDATEYLVSVAQTSDFKDERRYITTATTLTLPTFASGPVYWRVRARRGPFIGLYSETRIFYYRAPPSRDPLIVEIVGPGGTDPCGETAVSAAGCPPPGEIASYTSPGNIVDGSYNSTGDYVRSYSPTSSALNGSLGTLPAFAPNDYELRWTTLDEGSYAFYTFSTGNVIRVPFQIWDIGPVVPGFANDPSDDVRLIPILFPEQATDGEGGPVGDVVECEFGFFGDPIVEGMSGRTQRVYAYYPEDDYAAWEAYAAETTCDPETPPSNDEFVARDAFVDFNRGRPIQREVFLSSGFTDFDAIAGSVIRYYTVDLTTAGEVDPRNREAAVLDAPFPNPVAQRAAVPYELGATGPIRLSVYDVLGREVAVLVEGERPAGPAEARLDASRFAAGVYMVVLTAPGGRASRSFTVAR